MTIKKIQLPGMSKHGIDWKTKAIAGAGALIIFTGLVFQGVRAVNSWFDSHYFQFNKVVEISFNRPIEVKTRQVKVEQVINIINEIPELEGLALPIEKYICEKWGPYDCKTAIAIARAESGMREDAININTNDTIDVGIFQINSVHFKKAGCNIKDLVDQYKNVDCAYQIFEAQGWSPWVVFKNGNFKNHLTIEGGENE